MQYFFKFIKTSPCTRWNTKKKSREVCFQVSSRVGRYLIWKLWNKAQIYTHISHNVAYKWLELGLSFLRNKNKFGIKKTNPVPVKLVVVFLHFVFLYSLLYQDKVSFFPKKNKFNECNNINALCAKNWKNSAQFQNKTCFCLFALFLMILAHCVSFNPSHTQKQ